MLRLESVRGCPPFHDRQPALFEVRRKIAVFAFFFASALSIVKAHVLLAVVMTFPLAVRPYIFVGEFDLSYRSPSRLFRPSRHWLLCANRS